MVYNTEDISENALKLQKVGMKTPIEEIIKTLEFFILIFSFIGLLSISIIIGVLIVQIFT